MSKKWLVFSDKLPGEGYSTFVSDSLQGVINMCRAIHGIERQDIQYAISYDRGGNPRVYKTKDVLEFKWFQREDGTWTNNYIGKQNDGGTNGY